MEKDIAEKMYERMDAVIKKVGKEFDQEKLKETPLPRYYREIKEKAEEYKKKHAEIRKKNKDANYELYRIDKDEEKIIRQAEAYENFVEFVKRVIHLDKKEMKKQMEKDWDKGLLDVQPEIEPVIESLSFHLNLETVVEEIFWSCEGNLRVSSLPEEL